MIPSSSTLARARPSSSPTRRPTHTPALSRSPSANASHSHVRSSHSRSQSNVTLVDANPSGTVPLPSSKPASPADTDPTTPLPRSTWISRVLLPHLLPPLVSLAVILVVFPLTFFAGTSLPPVAKIAISAGLAAQLCYACLHVASAAAPAARRAHRYLPLSTRAPSPSTTPTRTLILASTYVLRTLLPVVSWLTLFSLLKHMPATLMSPVDTTSLPRADSWLVGKPAYMYFAPARDQDASVPVDVLAWVTYGVWHFVSPLACCLVLGVVGARRARGERQEKPVDDLDEVVVVWENTELSSEGPRSVESVELRMVASPDATDVDSDSDHTLSEIVVVSSNPTRTPSPPQPQAIPTPATNLAARLAATLSSPALVSTLSPIHTFLTSFGSMNLCGVLIQYVYPTAPPWYNQHFGSAVPANPLAVHGDPAGLARIDALLGAPVYKHVFASSPVVFGAWPSLHAGFATMCALAVAASVWQRTGRRGRSVWNAGVAAVGVAYVALVWWATMYLCHHFLVDVVAGSAIALGMYSGVGWVKRRRMRAVGVAGGTCGEWEEGGNDEAEAAAAAMATGLWAVPARGDGRQRRGTGASDATLA